MVETTTTRLREVAPGRSDCLRQEDAVALLSMGSVDREAARLLSHVEACTSCRLLVGAAATDRVALPAPRPLFTLAAGDRLGDRYEILRLLARGGMGEVYEARDHLLGEVVALKTIVLSALDSAGALAALKAEVQLARKVSHRNVCRLLEFGIHAAAGQTRDSVPFFTMELLRGETLRARLRRTPTLTAAEALPIVLQIIDGLIAIHAAGIVHRDLKPENVFLLDERQGLRAVVMDFGLARPLELPETLSSAEIAAGDGERPAGTLEYMAPEQLGGAQPTPSFDVYALGVMMFEMLAGERPFQRGVGTWTTTLGRLDQPAPKLSKALAAPDRTWEQVIDRCLARDPGQRPGSIAEVRDALLPAAPARSSAPRWTLALAGGVASAGLLVAGLLAGGSPTPVLPPAPPALAATTPSPAVPPAPPAVAAAAPERPAPKETRSHPRLAGRRPAVVPLAERAPAPRAPAEPADANALLDRAEQLLVAGEGAAACALGQRAASQAPTLPAVHRFLGKCYMRLPDAARARAHYLRYLDLAPDAPDRLFVRAMVGQQR